MPIKSSPTNAAEKTCRVLCALSDPRIRRMSDIAAATQISKVSVLRVLETLVAEGLVQRDQTSKEYSYGPEAYIMASALSARHDLRAAARPSLSRLAELTGDTVCLVVKAGMECVCLEREMGAFPIHASTLFVGSRRPPGVGSGPLAIFSWLDPAEREATLQHVKGRLKRYGGPTESRLREAAAETRERGYALVLGEVQTEIGAIAMILPDEQGRPLAAVTISSLKQRIREREQWLAQILSREMVIIRRTLESPAAAR
ncbi:MAG: IclR family transcriptional regulator [Luteibacter sp.]